jgi:transcriptional regulator with XRE-family HTH domain
MSRELKPLREVIARAVSTARLWPATVAQALGVSTRAWERLLSGKQTLKVRHLLALARLLGVPPEDFLDFGLPAATRAADRRLSDWLDPAGARARAAAVVDWEGRIAEAVRRELDAWENAEETGG